MASSKVKSIGILAAVLVVSGLAYQNCAPRSNNDSTTDSGAAKTSAPTTSVTTTDTCEDTSRNFLRGLGSSGQATVVEYAGTAGVYNSELTAVCTRAYTPHGTVCDEDTSTNSRAQSAKSNGGSGATWLNTLAVATPTGTGLEKPSNLLQASSSNDVHGTLVMDLGKVEIFNDVRVFQSFALGKTTEINFYVHPSTDTTAPKADDAGWVKVIDKNAIAAGVQQMYTGSPCGQFGPCAPQFPPASAALTTGQNAQKPVAMPDVVLSPTVITLPSNYKARYVKVDAFNSGALGLEKYIQIRNVKLFCSSKEM